MLGQWVGGRWIGGSVGKWSVVGGSVVGGFNKTRSVEVFLSVVSKIFEKLLQKQKNCYVE